MAATKGGTIISDLAKHRGMLYNDRPGKVMSTIENLPKEDWKQLKQSPEFGLRIEAMLKTIVSEKDAERAIEIITTKSKCDTFDDSLKFGQRTTARSLWESMGMCGTDCEAAVDSLLNMSDTTKRLYRTDSDFRDSLYGEMKYVMGNGTPARKAADHILNAVRRGEPAEKDIIVRLYLHGSKWNADDAEVLRDVENELNTHPGMLDRINWPRNDRDREFSTEMKDALKSALGNDYETYGKKLLDQGYLSVEDRAYLSRGWVYDDRESMIKSILESTEYDRKLLLSDDKQDAKAMRLQEKVLGRMTDGQAQLAREVLKQGEFHSEDLVRSFVVGAGEKAPGVIGLLSKSSAEEQAKMRDAYASKYGSNMVADLNYWFKSGEKETLAGIIKTEGRGPSEIYNEHLDQYSHSRDGFGQWFVDNLWDDTGFQAEQAISDYTKALSVSAQRGEQLQEARQVEISHQIAQSLSRFKNSKFAAGEAAANAAISGIAVVAAPFTAGTSLSLLSKLAIAGTAGAFIKVATKAAIGGDDYDFSAKRLTVDGGTGFVSGAISVLGTNEVASIFKLGSKVGTEAATIATSSLSQLGVESGGALLKEGSDKLIQQSLTVWVRQAMLTGSDQVNTQAIAALAKHVAVHGKEGVVQLAIQQSLNAAVKEVTAHTAANLTVQLGLPTVNGGVAGTLSGTITGVSEWDSRLPAGKNVENIAVSAGVNGTVGAGTAFSVAAGIRTAQFTYDQLRTIAGKADAELPPDLRGLNKEIDELTIKAKNGVRRSEVAQANARAAGAIDYLSTPSLEYKKTHSIKAVQSNEPFSWTNTKGELMHAEAGDWKVTQPDGTTSSIRSDIFKECYEAVPGVSGEFRKSAITMAQKVDRPITITTLEGPSHGKVGDYMVTGSQGEKYFVPEKVFESMYKPIPPAPPLNTLRRRIPMINMWSPDADRDADGRIKIFIDQGLRPSTDGRRAPEAFVSLSTQRNGDVEKTLEVILKKLFQKPE